MRCPYCGTLDNRVIDSRLSQAGEVTRRRRECEKCGRRYTTYERVEQMLPLVIKNDGRRQPYDRNKLLAGLRRACVKRPISAEALERLLSQVERWMADTGEQEVSATQLGDQVLVELRDLDQVAYVRFASVYRDFQDVSQFLEELTKLKGRDGDGR
ncbi:MAG: transcriptional regulator NrdR [Myxococcota bacterium]